MSEYKNELLEVEVLDPPKIKELENKLREHLEDLRKTDNRGCLDCNWRRDNSGTWRRSGPASLDCNANDPEAPYCYEQDYMDTARRIENLRKLEEFKICFEEPTRAKWRFPLRGMAQESPVYDEV